MYNKSIYGLFRSLACLSILSSAYVLAEDKEAEEISVAQVEEGQEESKEEESSKGEETADVSKASEEAKEAEPKAADLDENHDIIVNFALAKDVENLQAKNESDSFSTKDAHMYAWAKVTTRNAVEAEIVWTFNGKEYKVRKVNVPASSHGYRLFSYVTPRSGEWHVAIKVNGTIMHEKTFHVA